MSADAAELDEPIGYAEAMDELEEILEELEGEALDVDVLAERVRRASQLVRICGARITRARAEVEDIVADLEEFEVGGVGSDAEEPGEPD